MNEEIENIFHGKLIVDQKEIPIAFMNYSGPSEEYIVFYDNGTTPFFISDDVLESVKISLEFHVYTKSNYLKIVQELKKMLTSYDYNWIGDDGDMYETDTKYHHYVMNFEKIEEVIHG